MGGPAGLHLPQPRAPDLLRDEKYGDDVSADIAAATRHLRAVLERIDQGQGIAGQLTVADPDKPGTQEVRVTLEGF